MDIKEIIDCRYKLPESSLTKICESMERVSYPKGYNVLEIGKIERDVFFIAKGSVRAYTLVDGKEVTFWIGEEGATIVSMMGYLSVLSNVQGVAETPRTDGTSGPLHLLGSRSRRRCDCRVHRLVYHPRFCGRTCNARSSCCCRSSSDNAETAERAALQEE